MTSRPDSGAPTRRQVLRYGGMAMTAAVASVACSADGDSTAGVDLDLPPGPTETTVARGPDVDLRLLNTALSLEVLAVDTYRTAVDLALMEGAEVIDAATVFRQHHIQHRDLLFATVEAAGGDPFTTANPVVKAALVDPGLASVGAEGDFITLAWHLEQDIAQLYVHAATVLSTQELRSIAMSIGAVTSRQATVLDLLGDLGNERLALFPTDNPLPSDAVIPE